MEVHVEPERAVSSLHCRDGACVGIGHAWEVENGFGSFARQKLYRTHTCAAQPKSAVAEAEAPLCVGVTAP